MTPAEAEAQFFAKALRVFDVVSKKHAGNQAAATPLAEVRNTFETLMFAADPVRAPMPGRPVLQAMVPQGKIPIVVQRKPTPPPPPAPKPEPKRDPRPLTAPLPPTGKNRRYSREQHELMLDLWAAGKLSVGQIADRVGMPRGSVSGFLSLAREKGEPRAARRRTRN